MNAVWSVSNTLHDENKFTAYMSMTYDSLPHCSDHDLEPPWILLGVEHINISLRGGHPVQSE